MVTTVSGDPTGIEGGQTLVMDGSPGFTVRLTVTVWERAIAPTAVRIVIFAIYGALCGNRPVGSAVTPMLTASPGRTAPALGETVSQGSPEVRLQVTACGPAASAKLPLRVPGEISGIPVGWMVTPPAGSETTRVTATVYAPPAALMVTAEVHVPGVSDPGFTRTVSEAGKRPCSGATLSQGAPTGVPAVKTVPAAELVTDSVCVPGSVLPICQLNLRAAGETVTVVAADAFRKPAVSSTAAENAAECFTTAAYRRPPPQYELGNCFGGGSQPGHV